MSKLKVATFIRNDMSQNNDSFEFIQCFSCSVGSSSQPQEAQKFREDRTQQNILILCGRRFFLLSLLEHLADDNIYITIFLSFHRLIDTVDTKYTNYVRSRSEDMSTYV